MTLLRSSCRCLCVCVGFYESYCTRGQPLHKHHILHKHRPSTWLNAVMKSQRGKRRMGEKVTSPAIASSNQIPFKGTETRRNLPCRTLRMSSEDCCVRRSGLWVFVTLLHQKCRWRQQEQNFAPWWSENPLIQIICNYTSCFSHRTQQGAALVAASCELCLTPAKFKTCVTATRCLYCSDAASWGSQAKACCHGNTDIARLGPH